MGTYRKPDGGDNGAESQQNKEHPSQLGSPVLGHSRLVAHSDAGENCQQQQDGGQAQNGGSNHEGSTSLHVAWKDEDVHQGFAVVETSGHDAVSPQALGAQFVHFSAGGDGVAAGHHPVIGGRCDDDANPTHEARDETHHLKASGYHGGRSDVHAARLTRIVPPVSSWTEPSLGLPSWPSRAAGSGLLEMGRERLQALLRQRAAGTGAPGGDPCRQIHHAFLERNIRAPRKKLDPAYSPRPCTTHSILVGIMSSSGTQN